MCTTCDFYKSKTCLQDLSLLFKKNRRFVLVMVNCVCCVKQACKLCDIKVNKFIKTFHCLGKEILAILVCSCFERYEQCLFTPFYKGRWIPDFQ